MKRSTVNKLLTRRKERKKNGKRRIEEIFIEQTILRIASPL
jgi:hypothetical protein